MQRVNTRNEVDEEATPRVKHPLAMREGHSVLFMNGWNAALKLALASGKVPECAPEWLVRDYQDGWDSLVLLLASLEPKS